MAEGTTQTPGHITHPPAKRAEVYEKKRKAAELRRHGTRWEDIAAEVGYADGATAFNAVNRLMQEERRLAYDEVELYRTEQLARYLDLLKVNWPLAEAGSEKHSSIVIRILTRIDKLTGAEAPIKFEMGEGDIDHALRELEAEIGRRSAAAQVQAARGQDAPG